MNRLTNKETKIKLSDTKYDLQDHKMFTKLYQVENIECDLEIDLIPLLTILINGYAFWKYEDFIYKVKPRCIYISRNQIENITYCYLDVDTDFDDSNKDGKYYGESFAIPFSKEYGKTLTLTREELEK